MCQSWFLSNFVSVSIFMHILLPTINIWPKKSRIYTLFKSTKKGSTTKYRGPEICISNRESHEKKELPQLEIFWMKFELIFQFWNELSSHLPPWKQNVKNSQSAQIRPTQECCSCAPKIEATGCVNRIDIYNSPKCYLYQDVQISNWLICRGRLSILAEYFSRWLNE